MAFPKTKSPIKQGKIKKLLFARGWYRGATARWKSNFYEKKSGGKNIEDYEV